VLNKLRDTKEKSAEKEKEKRRKQEADNCEKKVENRPGFGKVLIRSRLTGVSTSLVVCISRIKGRSTGAAEQ